jgi:hypothetical protein
MMHRYTREADMDKGTLFRAITQAALSGLQAVNRDPAVPVNIPAAHQKDTAEKIASEVLDAPEMKVAANEERAWYQQRSKWASLLGTISTILSGGAAFTPPPYQEFVITAAGLTSASAAYLGYRAGTATKPLFSN